MSTPPRIPREKYEALGESLPQPVQQQNVMQEKQKGLFYRFYLRLCEIAIVCYPSVMCV